MIHKRGYWIEISDKNTHLCDEKLCRALIKMFTGKTIVDIGCGDGSYTRNFIDAGIECTGYDGSPLTTEISNGLCHIRDFSQPVNIGLFGVVISLEVGEHIPKKYEKIFIDNLCNTSRQWVCLSWAIKGQPGFGHVNCQNNDYIIAEMSK